MNIEERQTAALANRVAWLEDELRDARASMTKLAQALEQSQAQVWELRGHVHHVEDGVAALVPQLAGIPGLDEQLRQLKDVIARVHEQALGTDTRLAELGRQVDSAAERERQALNELAHRLDTVERQTQGTMARFDALDEGIRRGMEAVTLLRQRADEVARTVDGLETRLARVVETGGRTDHEFSRLGGEIDGLRKQDEVLAERIQVYTEMLKRLEGQISLVAADVLVKHDVFEQLDLSRVEIHRLEERVSIIESTADGLHDRDEETTRQVTLLEGRHKGLQERLTGLQSDFAGYRTYVNEQFQRMHQLQERLKRRQMEELERELRELRIHAFRSAEDGSGGKEGR